MPPASPNRLAAVCQVLERHPEVELAVLFGSTAAGTEGSKSDVDLAVRLRESPEGWKLGELAMEVQQATGKRADIVLLSSIRSALLRHEIAKGKLLKGDVESWVEFRRRALREWRELRPRFRRLSDLRLKKEITEEVSRRDG